VLMEKTLNWILKTHDHGSLLTLPPLSGLAGALAFCERFLLPRAARTPSA